MASLPHFIYLRSGNVDENEKHTERSIAPRSEPTEAQFRGGRHTAFGCESESGWSVGADHCLPVGNRLRNCRWERRWRAAKLAEIELSAIVLDARPTPAELLKLQLKVNCLRKSLKPVERARAYQRLLEQEQCSQHALAQSLNVSDGTVTSYLSILTLAPEIRAHRCRRVGREQRLCHARAGEDESKSSLADQVASGGLTRDAVQGHSPQADGKRRQDQSRSYVPSASTRLR